MPLSRISRSSDGPKSTKVVRVFDNPHAVLFPTAVWLRELYWLVAVLLMVAGDRSGRAAACTRVGEAVNSDPSGSILRKQPNRSHRGLFEPDGEDFLELRSMLYSSILGWRQRK